MTAVIPKDPHCGDPGPAVDDPLLPQATPHACRAELARSEHPANRVLDWLADRVVFFHWGDFVFVTFGLFAALGMAVTLFTAGVVLIGQGLSPLAFLALALGSSFAVVVGSWLLAQLLDWRLVLQHPLVALRRPVFVSWGGLLLLPAVLWVVGTLASFEPLALLDAAARTVPAGHALGRIGCLSYGCCFGLPTHGALAITYRDGRAKAVRIASLQGVRLHPAALYEALLDVLLVVVTNAAAAAGAPLGLPVALGFVVYGAGRFGIEFVKDNRGRFVVGPLAINHLASVALIGTGLLLARTVLAAPLAPLAVAWAPGLEQGLGLLPAILPAVGVVFFGFSLHGRRIGTW